MTITTRTSLKILGGVAFFSLALGSMVVAAERDGLLHCDGTTSYPIGFYALPKEDDALKALAASGVNLVHCNNRFDLDRVQAAGLRGWVSVALQAGPTESLKKQILELRDHPALALWEGPDEVVWNFTAYSGLQQIAGFSRDDWWVQTPKAVAYAKSEAAKIIPKIHQAAALIRELDPRGRPIWINEAGESDVIYVRQYLDAIDITGCDYYPIKQDQHDISVLGRATDRWQMTARDKSVWMVLQAFSWHAVQPQRYPTPVYPTFEETRSMAYVSIAHGARGVLYWSPGEIDHTVFAHSLAAITSELSALQPFLIAKNADIGRVRTIETNPEKDQAGVQSRQGVRLMVRQAGPEYLIVVCNEDPFRHLGVEVSGLDALNGRELHCLYSDEVVTVARGELMTRLQGFETKVFATSRRWESS